MRTLRVRKTQLTPYRAESGGAAMVLPSLLMTAIGS